MNVVREAAIAMVRVKAEHPGLAMRIDVDERRVRILAIYRNRELSREVTWTDIEQAHLNVLVAEVALVANKITAAK